MSTKVLGNETLVTSVLRSNTVLVEVGGSVRRITVENLMNAVNSGDEQMLRQVAWGVPIKQSAQSSSSYGVIGNTAAWTEYKLYCGRYLVTNDGRAAKLSPTNSAVFADGTTVDETKGHVMWIGPRLYYRVQTDSVSGVPVLWMSMMPIGGEFVGGANGGMYNCLGAYKGSISGSALVSRSGAAPAGERTISSFWTAAQVNGKEWGLEDYDQRKLIAMLGLSQYGDTNIQAKLGHGVCGSSSKSLWNLASTLPTGATKSLGDSWGKVDISLTDGSVTGDDCSRVNVMGIEDPYGWQWEMVQGVYFGSSDNSSQSGSEAFVYKGNRLPTTAELSSHPDGEYRQSTRNTSSGYIKEIVLGEHFDLFAKTVGGGSTSYWCDYSYANSTGQLFLVGGSAYGGAWCGLACAVADTAWSYSAAGDGSRLAYFGNLTFVSGSSLMSS